jgi:lipopolysaccharide/colanic/teichoic acid biosynthesis glycosyltransferase
MVRPPFAKLILDKLLAVLLLVLTLPLSLIILIGIKLDGWLNSRDRGPLFYRETRVSQGRPFELTKFRIFTLDAVAMIRSGEITKKIENNPRNLTAFGRSLRKYGLDELPQFWNILKGDMSFVGPRPKPVKEYEDQLTKGWWYRRVLRAGLTGQAQNLKGKNRTVEDEINADLDYLEKCRTMSGGRLVLVDLSILAETIRVLAKGPDE